jgi:tripartite-type tricarboxylate transporter receptor subunit TctC
VPLVLIINPDLPAKNVKEFIELAKAKPGVLNFASPGLGSTTFIAGACLRRRPRSTSFMFPIKAHPNR